MGIVQNPPVFQEQDKLAHLLRIGWPRIGPTYPSKRDRDACNPPRDLSCDFFSPSKPSRHGNSEAKPELDYPIRYM
jgi:hypothetical protein